MSLALARKYSGEALVRTVEKKRQLEQEQQRLAEEKARAEKQAELERERRRQEALKQQSAPDVKPEPKPVEIKVPEEPKLVERVEVAAAENLMMIAARPEVYNDGQLWPLIYKANRDQIKDPKEIFPGQVLVIPRDKSREEIDAARLEAEQLNLF
jgi:nucleoid-associated protein YgaU